MIENRKLLKANSPYTGALTREQFLFYEMKTTAELLMNGMNDQDAVDEIVNNNLFQYPTERTISNLAGVCVKRLRILDSEELVSLIADGSAETGKQICLYAMMKQYRLVWDFMITVIGEKYTHQDWQYSRADLNSFFLRLQEQDNFVASWSVSTIEKCKQVITRILVENEYLDNVRADHLNPVMLNKVLEDEIMKKGDQIVLPAFNCFR